MKRSQLYWLVLLSLFVFFDVCQCVGFNGTTSYDTINGSIAPTTSNISGFTTAETATPSSALLTRGLGAENNSSRPVKIRRGDLITKNLIDGQVSTDSPTTIQVTTQGGDGTTLGSFSTTIPTNHSLEHNSSVTEQTTSAGHNPPTRASQTSIHTSLGHSPSENSGITATFNNKNKGLISVIVVVAILLLLLFFVMLFMLVRKKKRSGSKNFSKRSRRANGQDVWAGQVPELAEGRPAPENSVLENGAAVLKSQAGDEQEMTTFGEKRMDSVVEMDELVASDQDKQSKNTSDISDEKKPLLEEDFEETAPTEKGAEKEQFPLPPPEPELGEKGDDAIAKEDS
ncbi:leukosialin [Pelobates fuscus]|uniref:leukosialin n=1 Tax=Pelobates fuscus TaxID=191477 RepID=UPI002FE497D5